MVVCVREAFRFQRPPESLHQSGVCASERNGNGERSIRLKLRLPKLKRLCQK